MNSKEIAHKKISELVERFTLHFDSYKNSDYNETLTRRDFIDPFFKSLGWDVDNENGASESYREVIHEDKIKIGGATKAPDYAFRNQQGNKLFFLEAKKPNITIKESIQPAYQVRRYGWSAKLPISIVTDFEEFSIYDCTVKPIHTDKSSIARIKYISFKDYLNEFDFVWETFAKENVQNGSLDKYAKATINKKGTSTVDKEFLQSLDSWRKYLASNIAINNKKLNDEEINFVVQQTLDRIIFLRIAEDRNIETYGKLNECVNEKLSGNDNSFYKNLFKYFNEADEKYNSGLFDFKKDKISEHLKIENKTIKTIISELYYPKSPYEFSVLSVEILGSAYEQFLGKVIRITPSHQVKIEEKPEVRKAGGVYYTPKYIVDYIVKNTVGKLIDGKTPKEISSLKIVDPACGSGSFLIGAYQYLLDWHKNYYSNPVILSLSKDETRKYKEVLTPDGNLTTSEKKRILLNNIFGVDIDANAVEVTKLSLLLKCLEGETLASIKNQITIFHERVLPTLDSNIKCGNSLIDTDFYDGQIDFGDEKKTKPFNWQNNFSEVYSSLRGTKQSGFDVVIGNPPYGAEFSDEVKNYLLQKFSAGDIEFESYLLFIEQGFRILNLTGHLGFIVPNNLLTNFRYEKIRKLLLENYKILQLIDLGSSIFKQASVDTCIVIGQKQLDSNANIKTFVGNIENVNLILFSNFRQNDFAKNKNSIFNIYVSNDEIELCKKIESGKKKLMDFTKIYRGIEYGYNSEFIHNKKTNRNHKPIIAGRCFHKYTLKFENKFVAFDENDVSNFKTKDIYENDKIFMRRIGSTIIATLDTHHYYNVCDVYNLLPKNDKADLKFLLGLLNSSLMSFYLPTMFKNAKKLFPKIPIASLELLPIVSTTEKNQNEIVKLVNQLLKLNEEKVEAKLETKINQLKSKIDYCESRINEIVYQLYELTEEEIKIVEGK